jgi:hypothetical protein
MPAITIAIYASYFARLSISLPTRNMTSLIERRCHESLAERTIVLEAWLYLMLEGSICSVTYSLYCPYLFALVQHPLGQEQADTAFRIGPCEGLVDPISTSLTTSLLSNQR